MREEFVNPFLTPALDVWEHELGESLHYLGASAVPSKGTTAAIAVVVGVTGSVRGAVLYEFDKETAEGVVTRMLRGPVDLHEEIALSALSELANMITGNAASQLAAAGYPCEISPTVVLNPKQSGFTFRTGTPQIQARFMSLLGELKIRVGLSEGGR